MGLNLGVMSAAVTLDDKDYRSKLSGIESASANTFRRIAQLAAGYLSGRALFGFAKAGIQAFADLQTAQWNFEQVFKDIPGAAAQAEAEMRKTYKLSETTSKNMLSRAADQLQAFGFSAEKSLELARKASERGIDLASFKGGNQADAVDAIVSALTGQTERMKRYGVVVQQGSKRFEELTEKIKEATGATDLQAKAQATLQNILEQSKNAEGDYTKEGSTIAQQQMDLAQATQEAQAALGRFLAQGVSPLMDTWNGLLVKFAQTDPALQNLEIRAVAASVAFAALAKFGALAKANTALSSFGSGLKSVIGGFTGIQAQKEAEAEQAAAELKIASAERVDAVKEALSARESVRIARRQSQEAAAAVESAKRDLDALRRSGAKAKAISAAEMKLSLAKQASLKADLALSQSQSALATKRNLVRTATLKCTVAEVADTAAKARNALASTAAGRAQIVFASGLKACKTAAAGLYAALGPVGIAMIVLSATYMSINYLAEKNAALLDGQAKIAEKNAEAATEASKAQAKKAAAEVQEFQRLQELSKYERLNNAEKKEAEHLISKLTSSCRGLGVSIDKTTGKVRIASDAWDMLTAAQRRHAIEAKTAEYQALKTKVNAKLKKAIGGMFWRGNAGRAARDELLRNFDIPDQNLRLKRLKEFQTALYEKGNVEEADSLNEVINDLKEQIECQKELKELRTGTNRETKKQEELDRKNAELSKKIREEMTNLSDKEWNIKFNAAAIDEQVAMLSKKINEVFSRQSGKFSTVADFVAAPRDNMSVEELKDLQEIIELEGRRAQLRKQSADAFKQESKEFGELMRQRERRRQDNEVEREIAAEERNGNSAGVDAIIQREYEKARDAAKNLQREYERAVKDAQADKVLTEDEKKRVADLRSRMQEAMSDEDRWRERGLSAKDDRKNTAAARNTVGAFSSAILAGLLGANTPEQETAKNTREMVRLQRRLLDQKGGTLSYS